MHIWTFSKDLIANKIMKREGKGRGRKEKEGKGSERKGKEGKGREGKRKKRKGKHGIHVACSFKLFI